MATLAAAAARQATNSLRLSSARTASQISSLTQRRGIAGAADHHGPPKVNCWSDPMSPSKWKEEHDQHSNQGKSHFPEKNAGGENRNQIGWNVSRKDKVDFLVKTILDLNNSKEAVYGTLDGWVAWEQEFPIGKLRMALIALEKEQEWHRIIQVIKWMLSKGQGTTMGTYGQLIRALDIDQRPGEAHKFWQKKIGMDLHPVPWELCKSMISIYYRNNMLENLVKLFEGLEAFDRKPPQKSIVRKVADAYEILGRLEKKERVLEKYNYLFTEVGSRKKHRKKILSEEKKNNKLID